MFFGPKVNQVRVEGSTDFGRQMLPAGFRNALIRVPGIVGERLSLTRQQRYIRTTESSSEQGCQMVCFRTKNPNLGKFRRTSCNGRCWHISWTFGPFYSLLVYFSRFGILYLEKSGNPGSETKFCCHTKKVRPSIKIVLFRAFLLIRFLAQSRSLDVGEFGATFFCRQPNYRPSQFRHKNIGIAY
jgi:hypothetical protein